MEKQIKQVRTRFAPSPTGFLHIGNLRTALYAYLYARKNGGKFILRIEDTDLERYVEGALEVILDTLKAAGIEYDEGPVVGGPFAPYIQSERKSNYAVYANELVEKGGAYRCFCQKKGKGAVGVSGESEEEADCTKVIGYDRKCRNLSKKKIEENLKKSIPFVIRQKIPLDGKSAYKDLVFGLIEVENKELEDQILIKSDGMPTYNFANVVDDHDMAITCVMRGSEYVSSTPKYNLLYQSFGWEIPVYIHLPHIMKDATHKLSKRNGDASFDDLVAKGFLSEAVVNYIALLGWAPKNNVEKMTMEQMKEMFSVDGISKSQSIFDEAKLKWLNAQYIKELPFDKFKALAKPFLQKSKAYGKYDENKLLKLVQGRIDTLADIPVLLDFLEEFGSFDKALYTNEKLKTSPDVAKEILPKVKQALSKLKDWNEQTIHDALFALVQALEVKNGIVLWPSRVAISGKASTPGGAVELSDILGKTETLRRLDFSIGELG